MRMYIGQDALLYLTLALVCMYLGSTAPTIYEILLTIAAGFNLGFGIVSAVVFILIRK